MPGTIGYAAEEITKADEEKVAKFLEELEVGRKFRSSRERIWKRSERQYQGKTWENRAEDPTSDLINVNVSFSTINTIEPHLSGMEPEFSVVPFSHDATPKNARLQEAFLNRMWRHKPVGAQLALKKAVHDYLVYGDGYLKTTWQTVVRSQSIDQVTSVVEMFVDRIDPWDVWIDPNSTGIDKARWVAVRLWTTEDEVRNDESLTIPSAFEFTTIDSLTDDEDEGDKPYHATSNQRKWVVLYELYDIVNQRMYVVPRDGASKRPWKVVDGIKNPIEQIPGYTIPKSPYHMGELEQIFDIQMEIDKTRSQIITHRKRNVAKVAVKEEAMADETRSALTSSVVNEIVVVKGEGSISDVITPIQLQPLPSESYQSLGQAMQDIYEITGVSDYQRGSAPDITRTATEAQIMQGSSNVKIDAKLNTVEHALRNVGEYMLGIARDAYPETDFDEMAMFVGGTDGRSIAEHQAGEDAAALEEQGDIAGAQSLAQSASLFGEATLIPNEDMFIGTYEVLVEHASTDMLNPKVKAESYRDTIQTLMELMPALQQQGVNVDLSKVVRLWLESKKVPGVDAILAAGAAPPIPGDPAAGGGGAPQGLEGLMGLLGGGGQPPPAPPDQPITPDNSGALDPDAYPIVGR
jgi:hypothetical protein